MSSRVIGVERNVSCLKGWAVVAALLATLAAAQPAHALDLHGRIDTRYQLQAGDDALDNEVFQYQSLDLSLLSNLSFLWDGGIRKDFNGTINTVTSDGTEQTNIAFRGLPDAVNPDQTIEYRIYSACLKYSLGFLGAQLGRSTADEYEFSSYDGLMLWVAPFDWLRLEAFGGKPWHYGPLFSVGGVVDLNAYWGPDEWVAGGGLDLAFLDGGLKVSVRYLWLREEAQLDSQVGAASSTYLATDNLAKARIVIAPWQTLSLGASGSFLNFSPRSATAWVQGSLEPVLTSFALSGSMQFIDISAIADRLTQFSAFLTSSHPYLSASADVSKNFAEFFPRPWFLSDIELELGYEHRQPLYASDLSQFNPQYDQFRVGTLLATRDKWSLLVYYNLVLTSGTENTLHAVGGEIAKKWDPVDVRLGSSFNVNLYETNYTGTVVSDSFYAQEYYLKVKWAITKFLDLSLKGAYEMVELSSLTSAEAGSYLVYAPMTELFAQPRRYLSFDLRLGFRY